MQRVALGHKMFSRRFDLYLPRDDRGRGFCVLSTQRVRRGRGFCILSTQRFRRGRGAIRPKMAIFKGGKWLCSAAKNCLQSLQVFESASFFISKMEYFPRKLRGTIWQKMRIFKEENWVRLAIWGVIFHFENGNFPKKIKGDDLPRNANFQRGKLSSVGHLRLCIWLAFTILNSVTFGAAGGFAFYLHREFGACDLSIGATLTGDDVTENDDFQKRK